MLQPPFYLPSKIRMLWVIHFHPSHRLCSCLRNHSTVSLLFTRAWWGAWQLKCVSSKGLYPHHPQEYTHSLLPRPQGTFENCTFVPLSPNQRCLLSSSPPISVVLCPPLPQSTLSFVLLSPNQRCPLSPSPPISVVLCPPLPQSALFFVLFSPNQRCFA